MSLPSASQQSVPAILVLGSLNMDMVVRVSRAPGDGETIEGQSIAYFPGGKGGNQAVGCARQGASVCMIGRVGADAHGAALRAALAQEGIGCDDIPTDDAVATGVAVVMVDDQAQNRIVVVPGANGTLHPDPSVLASRLKASDWLVMQLEVPLPAVLMAAEQAQKSGCRVVLNPSPSQSLPAEVWPWIDTLVLNESEAQALTQVSVSRPEEAAQAGQWFLFRGVRQVVVTLGAQGAVAVDAKGGSFHPALPVKAVDTTAAGDTFLGALVVTLASGGTLNEGVTMGLRAASLCVQTVGAQPSIPTRAAVLRTPQAPSWTAL
ncbi:ribokinase [Hydrogenophaga crassostreae]|nr:ribokinase [Hydrogenophaga crassostreae]